MGFFERVDALGIGERHITELQGLEETEGKRLLERYRLIRQELRDRLDTLPGDRFTAQQLRGVLVQVEGAIAAMSDSLLEKMTAAANKLAGAGVDDLLEEIRVFEEEFTGAVVPIHVNAAAIATESANFLFNQYEASIEAYSEDLRRQMEQSLNDSIIMEHSLGQVVSRLGKFFMGEEWKLLRIARTELHNIYGLAKVRGMTALASSSVPGLMKALLHPMDERTEKDSKYLARLNPILPIDVPFEYEWAGKVRRFMAPPDRPNDRAILIPFRDSWDRDARSSTFENVSRLDRPVQSPR